jgi:hypothetical protein
MKKSVSLLSNLLLSATLFWGSLLDFYDHVIMPPGIDAVKLSGV